MRQGLAILAVTILAGASGAAVAQLPTGAQQPAPEDFRDVRADHWAADAIRRLARLGIITGYPDGTFGGTENATRYELAVVAARIVDLLVGEGLIRPESLEEVDGLAELSSRLERVEAALRGAGMLSDDDPSPRGEGGAGSPGAAGSGGGAPGAGEPAEGDAQRAASAEAGGESGRGLRLQEITPEAGVLQGGGGPLDGTPALRRPLAWWLDVAIGHPVTATVHVGLGDLVAGAGVRGGFGVGAAGEFRLELAAHYPFPTAADAPLLPYVAAGPVLRGGPAGTGTGLHALAGVEIPLGRELTEPGFLFLELGPDVLLDGGVRTALLARAGLGYRF